MMRVKRAFTIVFALILACGCAGKPYSSPGTFYVVFDYPSPQYPDLQFPPETMSIIRGHMVVGNDVRARIVPRDRPDLALRINATDLTVRRISGGRPIRLDACRDPYNPPVYALSPDGKSGLCSSINDQRHLYMFDPAGKRRRIPVRGSFFLNASASSFGWLDHGHFVATMLDQTCPRSILYGYFAARVTVFSRTGEPLSRESCAFGVVAGGGRIALLSQAWNSLGWKIRHFAQARNDGYEPVHHIWSTDNGATWHDGVPLVFDGNGRLLYANTEDHKVLSEDGQTVFEPALEIQWSK